ncbi:heparan-alpha-glucosaminide N-acetyltransferase [Roseibium sp. M-1]
MSATRLAVLDLARGLAVFAMAAYHFSWDLSWFGFVDWPVAQGTGWRIFAASIAGSFLFLAGISLDFAHHQAIRWRPFWRRFAVIAAAAAAVSIATYFVFGDSFVRFGILHCIAVSSLVALPFTRLPLLASAGAAVLFLTVPFWAASSVFDGAFWFWTGLGRPSFGSVDYVPLFPWAGLTLAGLFLSRAFRSFGIWQRLSNLRFNGHTGRLTRFLGRHSLPVYLLHQPLLYGLVWGLVLLSPEVDRAGNAFVRNCAVACEESLGSTETCEAACRCTLTRMQADGIWEPLTADPGNMSLRQEMDARYAACLADPEQASQVK